MIRTLTRFRFSTSLKLRKAAVLLSGCGVADGSEITEAVSLLISLSKLGVKFQCFAPNKPQKDVIDHTSFQALGDPRNVLLESARICRGDIKNLLELKTRDFDGLFMPGGFGAAKNWSSFAEKGAEFTVDAEIERILLGFHQESKPIAACCITPIILAKVFGGKNVKLTLGKSSKEWEYAGTIGVAQGFGAIVEEAESREIVVDEKNRIVTCPAFMKGSAGFGEVFEGISKMVLRACEL